MCAGWATGSTQMKSKIQPADRALYGVQPMATPGRESLLRAAFQALDSEGFATVEPPSCIFSRCFQAVPACAYSYSQSITRFKFDVRGRELPISHS